MADGNPYIQSWADENSNIITRTIPRPHAVSTYFERSLRVDNHNRARQNDPPMEEAWLTQGCWL
jgi:hypothetical protein